ncbi:MAG TPA: choice-of-anchor P family protein [Acidimicrobiales bacterium]
MAAVIVAGSVVGSSALFGSTPAQAAAPDSGTSSAYGIQATLLGGSALGPLPVATLGAAGQSSTVQQVLPADVPDLLTANTLNAQATSTNFGQANEQINAASGTEGIAGLNGVSLLGSAPPLLDIQAVNVTCNSNAGGSTASTEITGLSIDGASPANIPSDPAPNTGLTASELGPLSGLVNITLNDQTVSNAAGATSITVIGVHIQLLGAVNGGIVVNLSEATCAATGPDIEAPPTVTSVTPNYGIAAGGTSVTIQGSGFQASPLAVKFGGVAATDVTYVPATATVPAYLTAVDPSDTGITANTTVAVQVENQYGFSTSTVTPGDAFTYEITPSISSLTAPIVGSLTPPEGPTTGGQPFEITGDNLGPDSVVYFGPADTLKATGTVVTDTPNNQNDTITGFTPADPTAGTVNVYVVDVGGTSNSLPYLYVTAPVEVTSVSPQFGPTAGGTTVTVIGQGFVPTSTVSFTDPTDGTQHAGTSVMVNSATQLTVMSPAHPVGVTDVIVTSPGLGVGGAAASSFATLSDHFTFEAAPTIASTNGIVPDVGPVTGGQSVTITGSNFVPGDASTVVHFTPTSGPGSAATNVVVVSSTEITATTPASPIAGGDGSGVVQVSVSDVGGPSTNSEPYTYVAPPVISSTNGIVPNSGPTAGGQTAVITGTNLSPVGTVPTVTFTQSGTSGTSTANATVTTSTNTSITIVTPPGLAGNATVTVTTGFGTSNGIGYTYVGPPSFTLSPDYGTTAGGTAVVASGTNLQGTTAAIFNPSTCPLTGTPSGGNAGTIQGTPTPTSVNLTTPAGTVGLTEVCLVSPDGNAESRFFYEGSPTLSSINPASGPVPGGQSVTLTGTNFDPYAPAPGVSFNGVQAINVVVVSTTEITAVTPASNLPGGAGPVPVTVTQSAGTSNSVQYTYVLAPVVSGISPTSGPLSGGETVIIKGTDLCGASLVLFGTASATIKTESTDCTEIQVIEPPSGAPATVPVYVTTPGGTAQSPENFTYIEPGYWEAASDGGVFSFGGAQFYGSVPGILKPGQVLNSPIVAMADTPDHGGYWLFAADGGVFTFGDANFYGSIYNQLKPGQVLNAPIVTAEATPDGGGYRMFAGDGGVFDFGDAVFEGSLPGENITPTYPVSGATAYPFGVGANPNNAGYWLVTADGDTYTFGNAPTISTGPQIEFGKVVALATTPDGEGYYMFLQSGPVEAFGDAVTGLGGASNPSAPIVFGQATSTGKGYWEFGADGGVFTFGDAPFEKSLGGIHLNAPITAAIAFGSQ